MTNLLATIFVSIVTNWTTVSTTIPAPCGVVGCAVYHYATDNQVGRVMSNTVAMIEWKGRKVEVVLESVEVAREERKVVR